MPDWQLDGGYQIKLGQKGTGRNTDDVTGINGVDYAGTDLNDTLIGTFRNDHIHGWGGDDVLWLDTDGTLGAGRIGGNDRASGDAYGLGMDLIVGDARVMVADGEGGDDRLFGDQNDDLLIGDAYDRMEGQSVGGADQLSGMGDDDLCIGDTSLMIDDSRGGDDILRGAEGDDRLVGDARLMEDRSVGGDDMLYGGDGDDRLFGDAYTLSDASRGGADRLYGDAGSDSLTGGRGNDILVGGSGADIFEFKRGDGVDTIRDFSRGGGDDILLRGMAGLTFAKLEWKSVNGHVEIDLNDYGGGVTGADSVLVYGIAQLTASDVLFV